MVVEHEYPLPPHDLFEVMTDLDYLRARHARFGGVGEPVVERTGDDVVVSLTRQLPLDKIPSAVQSFVGDGRITQVDHWQTNLVPLAATWRSEVGSAPAEMGGTHILTPLDDGTHYAITVDVKVRVPLIGGRIEREVRGYLEQLIGKELAYLAQWAAGER